MSYYNVYLVSCQGLPQDHHAIFVEIESDGSGYIYQVSGDIQKGMTHAHKKAKKPEDSASYISNSKDKLETVSIAKFPQVKQICDNISPPKKQFDGAKRLYPYEPLRRCQKWTAEAIEELKNAGVLEESS